MRTIVLLPGLPAALLTVDLRSAAAALVAMRKVISKLSRNPAMPVDHCNHHRMRPRDSSHVIGRVKAEHGQHHPTSAPAKSP